MNTNYETWGPWHYNKQLLNKVWHDINWVIDAEIWVICVNRKLRQITQALGLLIHIIQKTEFTNIFIVHFLNNLQKKTFLSEFTKVLCKIFLT